MRRLQWSSRPAPPARLAFVLGTKNAFYWHVSQNDDEFAKTSASKRNFKNFTLGKKSQFVQTRNFQKITRNPVLRIREHFVQIRIRIRIFGSVHLTNGSGCGSGRLKNIRIRIRLRIRNTAEKPTNLQKSILIGIATIPVYASQQSTINVRDKKSLYFFRCEGKLRRIGNLKNLHAGKNCNFYQHGTSNNSPKCPTKIAEKYFLPVSLLYLQMHRNNVR